MRRTNSESERGVVVVIFAVWLPVLVLFVSFAVDFAHFFDYSRNLQNRADAAAMAAAVAYGNTCFGSVTTAQADAIGKVAQQYGGPPNQDPANPYTVPGNLPYAYSTFTAAQYKNVPNLTQGTPPNFHMLLNSTQNWPSGSDWSMGTAGHVNSTALCSSTDEDGNVGPMVDVRLTQANLALFFPSIFTSVFTPTINAHARAALEGESSTPAEPIAVGDTGFTPCASVKLVNATTNSVIQTVTLSKEPPDPLNPTAPVQWDNSASPVSFQMPNSDNVYVQPFLSDCNGNGQTYDDSTNTGLLMINNHPTTDPTVNSGQPPQINSGGVTVTGTCTNSTQYFSSQSGGCTVRVNAKVTFASDVTPVSKAKVFLVQHTWDNVNNVWVTTSTQMGPPGNGNGNNCNPGTYCQDVTLGDSSGIDQFSFSWEEDSGTIGATQCSGSNPPNCTGTFNNGAILQQAFAACNGCDQPDDSGPIVFARISEADNTGAIIGNDTNSFAGGSSHNLVFTLKLSGLNVASPTSPATVLRFATSTNHQTGLVDCGQGSGTSNDAAVVYYGCGPANPLVPGMNPLFVYSRPPGSDCSPAVDGNTTGWPNGNNQDCVATTPGQRRIGIICPLVLRITGQPFTGTCTGGGAGTNCPANNWSTTTGSQFIPVGDPRAVTMIITSTVDLAAAAGSPQAWVPIRKFATFYVTGWDPNIKPSCNGVNEPYPVKGKQNSSNGAVWGHWINYEDTAGTPSGQLCVIGLTPTNCVPALTR